MRAMLLTAPGEIRAEDAPAPVPGPGQLLIRPLACGLCASELDLYLGRNPWQAYPALLGHEVVGRGGGPRSRRRRVRPGGDGRRRPRRGRATPT